ncbi:7025_t:CDS:2, partial [Acaulospora morrowiae]
MVFKNNQISVIHRYKVLFSILLLHLAFFSCFLYYFPYKCDVNIKSSSLAVDDAHIKTPLGVDPNVTVFLGILTVYEKTEIRNYLRDMYKHSNAALARYLGVQESPITVKFILGIPKDKRVDGINEESKKYGDIVLLNITENMEEGKTITFFDWFAENASILRKDDYMLKADDDSFIHLIHYYRDIQDLPRKLTYYGLSLNYSNTDELGAKVYMWGMGYTISRDLVEDIVKFDWVRSNVIGSEDYNVGRWMCKLSREKKYLLHYVGYPHSHGLVRNFPENPFHDLYFDRGINAHRFVDEAILIHRLEKLDDMKTIVDLYLYNDGFPKIKTIRNSTTPGLLTKKEIFQGCWVMDQKKQTWDQARHWTSSLDIYKNWFYEAWGFKEGQWYGYFGPK